MLIQSTISAAVETWRQRFPVYVQGEEDNACGLYCLATAGAWIGTIEPSGFATPQIWADLERLGWNASRRARLYDEGLLHDDVATLAASCGLNARLSRGDVLAELGDDSPALVYVAVTATNAKWPRPQKATAFTHYVLALEHIRDAHGRGWVVIADPHPWRPLGRDHELARQIYAVDSDQFLRAWRDEAEWSGIPSNERRPGQAWSLRGQKPSE